MIEDTKTGRALLVASDSLAHCGRPTRKGEPCQQMRLGYHLACKRHETPRDRELTRLIHLGMQYAIEDARLEGVKIGRAQVQAEYESRGAYERLMAERRGTQIANVLELQRTRDHVQQLLVDLALRRFAPESGVDEITDIEYNASRAPLMEQLDRLKLRIAHALDQTEPVK